ncbi:MAG: DUF1805 domain-containing protein [Paludibacteraceae bacterium]|nr:DUF1805 domain-containing protein [Paludibacteraceae bacterium]
MELKKSTIMEEKLETIKLNNYTFTALTLPTENTIMLLIKGSRLIVSCGYFSIATATKLGDAMALVRGVNSIDDVLNAKILELSPEAEKLGIKLGQRAEDALIYSETIVK